MIATSNVRSAQAGERFSFPLPSGITWKGTVSAPCGCAGREWACLTCRETFETEEGLAVHCEGRTKSGAESHRVARVCWDCEEIEQP